MKQKRILVIDDEPSVRDAFELALRDSGHAVIAVATGEEGLGHARNAPPDLVFLDLRMPGMDGIAVLRGLRQIFSDILPVYLVTAFRREFMTDLEKAAGEGLAFEILDKPVSDEQIQAVVRAVLEGPTEL